MDEAFEEVCEETDEFEESVSSLSSTSGCL